jgi:hypothetical protein
MSHSSGFNRPVFTIAQLLSNQKIMIIVQDTFVCKPGNASKVAKMFKETMGEHENVLHILTDMTGKYHRVVMLSSYESLAAYEKGMEMMMKDSSNEEMKKTNEKMTDIRDMYLSGSREIYRVW